jgi:hypothetical protein
MGTTPLSLWLPAGTYRVGGQAGDLRVPSFAIDLRNEDRSVVLGFALAESLRPNAGPGLALPLARRGDGVVRAGAWLGVDKVIAVSRVFEGEAAFLLGSIYDVRRGALLREGSVRMVAGSVPAANLGALAAFLLTGQSSRDVKDRTDPARAAIPVAVATPSPPPAPAPARALEGVPLPPPPVLTPASPVTARAPAAAVAETKPAAGAPPAPSASRAAAAPARAKAKPPETARSAAVAKPEPTAASTPAPDAKVAAAAPPPPPLPPAAARPSLTVTPPRGEPPRPAPAGASPSRPGRWMRPTAIGAGVAAGLLAALAIQQGFASRSAYADADAMVGSGGMLVPGSDPARYRSLRADGDAAKRNMYLSAGAAAVFGAAAGFLGWKSMDRTPGPAVALRF